MGFLSPKVPAMPDIPPPRPAPVIKETDDDSSEAARTRERLKRKKGVSSTILTGPRGLMPKQMPVTKPYLLSKE